MAITGKKREDIDTWLLLEINRKSHIGSSTSTLLLAFQNLSNIA